MWYCIGIIIYICLFGVRVIYMYNWIYLWLIFSEWLYIINVILFLIINMFCVICCKNIFIFKILNYLIYLNFIRIYKYVVKIIEFFVDWLMWWNKIDFFYKFYKYYLKWNVLFMLFWIYMVIIGFDNFSYYFF